MEAGDLFGDSEKTSPYLTKNSVAFIPKEPPILSLKGVTLTPVCTCPECGADNKTPWSKSRGRLRDWAAFLEEVQEIICTNESCTRRFVHTYFFEFPLGIAILNKSAVLKQMLIWFETESGQPVSMGSEDDDMKLLWDPFFESIPDWADHIPLSLFTNILIYTPPEDLEGVLLGRRGTPLFGGIGCREGA
ncbi:hypothetical protein [Leptospira wolffii]|uniref:hypothetical protein n=1 Tax=Leptospira wolffii TaxID=409998 RepID=UPI0002E5E605|nr:hypothetical protein [Leptospira wolffii]EPG64119.1 hypothetical protein LEP1GSC061_3453 [Leptospira wolffii serovar Khorat str. Khorat-H2]